EEMAIASGTPVPPVYVINEDAINAFAAGYSPSDAVIGVTQGAIDNLSRDELQGVIAHEFSHILNGDMKLNIRLMGILYGILMLALLGRIILTPSTRVISGRNRTHAGVLAIGIGLMAIGYIGQFFGNVIKSAVSRQREYLADASAVQFTRDPSGIAGALKRIGGYGSGSKLQHPESEELSHMFFAEGITLSFRSMMATHPPLDDRIKRIEPRWNGTYQLENTVSSASDSPETKSEIAGVSGFSQQAAVANIVVNPDEIIASIGNPSDSAVHLAREMISALPIALTQAAHEPYSARALVYMMLLDRNDEVRQTQLDHLENSADFGVFDAMTKLLATASLKPNMRFTLLEMVLPTLRQLSYEQYKLFLKNLDSLMRADGRIGLAEWALQKMLTKHLSEVFESIHTKVKNKSLEELKEHCEILISMLAFCDKTSNIPSRKSFDAGQLELGFDIQMIDKKSLSFKRLNMALDRLSELHPLKKPKLIKACIRTVSADEVISVIEVELLRTIADTLECPMPPLHAQQG
ncbi:MAG: putative tellurite resistance protein B-like protein, partial [Candidatus Azotimanducaceae bacterium]